MAIREVPKSFVYTCDMCSEEHVQENAGGHYTNSLPPTWSFKHGSIDEVLLLCSECAEYMSEAITTVKAGRRKP
jgi:hypothetical protein